MSDRAVGPAIRSGRAVESSAPCAEFGVRCGLQKLNNRHTRRNSIKKFGLLGIAPKDSALLLQNLTSPMSNFWAFVSIDR